MSIQLMTESSKRLKIAKYASYRPTGIDWLGSIPSHWAVSPGFSVLRERQIKNVGMIEKVVLSLSYGKLVIKPPEKLHGLVPESFETYQIVEPGNIILRPTDLQNDWVSLRVGIARNKGIITSAYLCLEALPPLTHEYAYLLLHTYDLRKIFYGMGSGLRQNLDFRDLRRMPVLIPPTDEQVKISQFIEVYDAQVSALIKAKKQLIALLTEQKQSIVQHYVLHGLNSTQEVRFSGIEWLGNIPKHWTTLRTKYLFREVDERSESGAETHLSMSQRLGLVPNSEMGGGRRFLSESYAGAKLCQANDLVLNRLKAHLGVFALAPQPGLVSPDYTVFRATTKICNAYFERVLKTPACRIELQKRAKGIVQGFRRLYSDDFYDIVLPVPPLEEQEKIVEKLDEDLKQINLALDRAHREIQLIQEYRISLISEVVTGQLDVQGLDLEPMQIFDLHALDINTDDFLDESLTEEDSVDGED